MTPDMEDEDFAYLHYSPTLSPLVLLLDNFVTLNDFHTLKFLGFIPSISDIIPWPLPPFTVPPLHSAF